MSGIYITGIEMPTNSELLCINIYPDGKVCIDLDLHCQQVATAIPVPPHGRTIDADALLLRAIPLGWSTPKWVSDIMIDDAPTIIPASKEY